MILTESDYTLDEDAEGVWLTVKNVSVWVRQGPDGVSVSLYPAGQELEDSLGETWVTYSEAMEDDG